MKKLIIYHKLPEGIEILKEENKEFHTKEDSFDTLGKDERKMKYLIISGGILVFIIFLYIFISGLSRESKSSINTSYQRSKIQDLSHPVITTDMIESTMKQNYQESNTDSDRMGINYKLSDRNYNVPPSTIAVNGGILRSVQAPLLSIPKNTYIHAILTDYVDSGNLSLPISAKSYTDLSSDHKILIPKGSHFIGKASERAGIGRIYIQFQSIIFPDGKEYKIRAGALGADNLAGLKAKTNNRYAKKGSGAVASSLLSAASQTARLTGSGFGMLFAGEMADESAGIIDDSIDYEKRKSRRRLFVHTNTEFKIVFY